MSAFERGPEENRETWTASVQEVIRTEHLPNTGQNRHRSAIPLGEYRFYRKKTDT
jgi:hypothetical protein